MNFSKPTMVNLKECVTNPAAEYRDAGFARREGWCFRLSLTGPDGESLPLFVHLFVNRSGSLEAEIESDQTDYSKPNWPHTIKRASIKRLKFWK